MWKSTCDQTFIFYLHSVSSTQPGAIVFPCGLNDQVHHESVLLFTVDGGQVCTKSEAALLQNKKYNYPSSSAYFMMTEYLSVILTSASVQDFFSVKNL